MSAQSNINVANARIPPDIIKIWYETFNNMTSNELVEVEYLGTSVTDEWMLMYANRNNHAGGKLCTLCDIVLMVPSHITEHNNGKRHKANVETKVRKFRHPIINPEKITFPTKINPNDDKIKEMKEKLRNEMISMNEVDMELIEYKFSNTDWNKLFTKNDAGGYVCNMCKSYTLINLKIIRNHVQTAKHKNNLDLIQGLYHPTVSPIKDLIQPPVKQSDKVKNPFSDNGISQKAKDLIEKHSEISVDLLLQIEIHEKCNDNWEKLISKPNNTNNCTCTLCKVNIVGIAELRKHLKLNVHLQNIKNINGIFHPILAPFKSIFTPSTAPINTADKESDNIKNNGNATTDRNKENSVPLVKKPETVQNVVTPNNTSIKSPTAVTKGISTAPNKEDSVPLVKKPETVQNVVTPNNTSIKSTPAATKGTFESVIKTEKNSEANVLTDDKFRTIIPTLPHMEIILIEFYKQNLWQNMIAFRNRTYSCSLCNVTKMSNFKCLLDHLKGKKHLFNMTFVKRFYHPKKTVPKNNKNLPKKNVNSGKSIPAIITSVASKEQQLSKPLNKDLSSSSEVIEIIPIPTEIITVEDSPEREILQDTKTITTTDNINESIDKETPTNINSNIYNDNENIINNQKDNDKIITSDNILVGDMNTVKDQHPLIDNNTDDDVIVVSNNSQNIVLNPVAVIAKNLNQNIHDGPQYQQNRIIEPRYKSGQNSTVTKSSSLNSSAPSILITDDKMPNFSMKSINMNPDNNIEGLIGVEYVVKIIQHAADDTPRYECCLCEIELGGIAMQNHLRNLKHRLKYLDRHFQTCVKQYNEHRNDGILMTEIVDRIAKAIEKYHGRDLPYECVHSDYRRNRQDIMAKVYSFRHSSELSGPSFTNIVDRNAVNDIIRNKHKLGEKFAEMDKRKTTFDKGNNDNSKRQRIHSPESTSTLSNNNQVHIQQFSYIDQNQPNVQMISTQQQPMLPQYPQPFNTISQSYPLQYIPVEMTKSLDNEEHRRLAENFIKNTKIRETRSPLSKRRHRSRSPLKSYGRSRSPSRRYGRDRRRNQSRSPLRENDVWQAYRRKFDIDVKIIDLDYDGYNKDPQSYPLYNEEWQIFWAKRMNELKLERKDHQTHDFTSEWATYFPGRLKELYEKDVEDLKVRLRERFVLPMHNLELKDKKYFVMGNYDENEPDMQIPPVPSIINSNYRDYSNRGTRSRSRSRSRSHRNNYQLKMENSETQVLSSDNDNDDNVQQNAKNNKQNHYDDDDRNDFGPLTVVSVLRLLTALEDNLGSLGPRVVDLLSKAITLKKIKPNESDELLLTVENCVFLETCTEKLKGQVLAGDIAATKLRVVRQAIKDITAIIRKANEERAKNPAPKPQAQQRKLPTSHKVGTSSTARLPPTSSSAPTKNNVNNQISGNKQPISQPQHPTVMSQAQKKELASKLASALVAAQGKTDISTENCEKLIEVYAMIDKKKSEENRGSAGDKPSLLTDTLTNILNSGNLSALSTLFNKQSPVSSTHTHNVGDLQNQINPNHFYNQGYQNLTSNNFGLNSNPNLQRNNFNQLANFDTSLNLNRQLNYFAGGGSHMYQNHFVQGSNQNWISGNNASLLQQLQLGGAPNLNQFPLNQSNLMMGNNQNNLLSQTLLNSSQMRSNTNPPNQRIDSGLPAYATGASYRGNMNMNDTVSYPNLWHRQNQQQQQQQQLNSMHMRGNQNNTRNAGNPATGQLSNQQQNLLGNRQVSIGRNLPNNNQNARNNTRRSDFGGSSETFLEMEYEEVLTIIIDNNTFRDTRPINVEEYKTRNESQDSIQQVETQKLKKRGGKHIARRNEITNLYRLMSLETSSVQRGVYKKQIQALKRVQKAEMKKKRQQRQY